MIRLYFILIAVLIYTFSYAQNLQQQNLPFFENNKKLDLALTGGFNNPQFSEVDINNDGIQDLFVFDKTGDVPMYFMNKGTADQIDYHFAPDYAIDFPPVRSWVLLRDFNCDGIMDLFAHNQVPAGITVYQGYYDNDKIAYTKIVDYIDYPGLSGFPLNLFITGEDYPAIDDLDNDGDLDILTFGIGGGWVEYYENQSQDLGYGCDSLIYELVDNCWGRFYESGLTIALELSPSMDSCVGLANFIGKSADEGVHVGSTLLTLDMDNDDDKELVLGDISFTNVVMGINGGGNPDTAWINSQFTDFPPNTTPVNIPTFPATFHVDVNNDGKKDFLAAPNARNISESYLCSWYYENTGDNDFPVFEYRKNTFLVEEMVDLGRGSAPTFFDHNSDGLMDIVVGSYGYYQSGGNHLGSIFLYENTGTIDMPKYTLVSDNYTNLPAGLNLHGMNITFGDLDNDGDKDMVFGEEFGKLYYHENLDTGNGIAVFGDLETLPDDGGQIDIGQFAAPYLVDIDRDGLLDLIIGELNGNINYWRNVGTPTSPVFTEIDAFFGEIDSREYGYPEGFCDVAVIEIDGEYVLFTGSEPGNIRRYINIEDSLAVGAPFFQADSLFGGIVQGVRTRLDVADINNDGLLEYLIGNKRGGLALYSDSQLLTSNPVPDAPDFTFTLYPNPAEDVLNIRYIHPQGQAATLRVYDVLGRTLHHQNINQNTQLDIQQFSNGIYFCAVQKGNELSVKKFIKQ